MDRKQVLDALKKARDSKKRNFKQAVDLAINLKNINLKDPKSKISEVVELPSGRGKQAKIAVIADGDALVKAKKIADIAISKDELPRLKEKKQAKKLADDIDFMIVQAQFMQPLATVLGTVLGPRGKMPHPTHIVPPVADITPAVERARNSVRVKVRDSLVVHVSLATEDMDDEKIADNVMSVVSTLEKRLPKGKDSIGNVFIKLTMGKAVKIE